MGAAPEKKEVQREATMGWKGGRLADELKLQGSQKQHGSGAVLRHYPFIH